MTDDSPPGAPFKTVLELRADPGDRAAVEAWIREVLDSASRTGTVQGSSVLTEAERTLVLLRFASRADHDRWKESADVASLLARGTAFVAPRAPVERTGLETWFALPGTAAGVRAPPKWKMALVTFCALVPQIVGLALVLPRMPLVASVAVTTAITVSALTWLIMPRLTRFLARWLYPKEDSP